MGTKVFKRGPDTPGQYDGKAGYFAHPDFVDATRSADANHLAKTRDSYERAFGPKEPQLIGAQSMPYPPRTPTPRDATRSQADNDRAKRISDWETQTGQDEPRLIGAQSRPIPPRTPTPRTSTAVAKPVPSAKITATDLPDEVDDQGRQYFQNYMIDTDGKKIPRIRVDGVGRTQDEPMDEGALGAAVRGVGELGGKAANAVKDMITKIPPGHPDYPLLQAARAEEQRNFNLWNKYDPKPFPWNPTSDADLVKSFNQDLNVRKGFGQASRESMPNDYLPTGAARAVRSQGAAFDAEQSMQRNRDLFKRGYGIDEDMTDVGDVVGQAARSVTDRLGQAASDVYEPIGNFFKGVKQGYNGKAQTATGARPDAPDQTDAETARLGRTSASADSEFVQSPDEAGRSLNYESREGDALLARIKSLALLR
jgi:hypothetical protein